ncbi:putative RNA recognition motif domain, nucleotide-binding alpha-beta plait domain superfamily [Helianthus annuus]|uniref:Putative nucleotide-binding alpha-beta plait domain-containing protein n=1 Tax=Helianthus annuus TaxID=4232 RepID=A0A251VD07_HELAN|nr:putative RNA recognition motif domain, nucleotide-binding alpha-beta plait domain superfamily [Helianthus annuus]KAJ0617696.1 putative RNA recognition motif domain, nucleotide-binding alpha-beta plait domain superfamily [Helianthus annuus]
MADRRNLYGTKVKLFVSNLPEGCTPWELRKCMESYGEVAGSYVARKRDKQGSRFGFVSFLGVRDKRELLGSLGGVRMGDFKLRINVARFALENSEIEEEKVGQEKSSKPPGQHGVGGCFSVRGGRSYKEVVGSSFFGGGSDVNHVGKPMAGSSSVEKVIVVPDRVEAFKGFQGLAVVGRAVNLETLVDIDRLLNIAKIVVANVQYLGGLTLLISFHEEESVKRFLSSKNVWEPWFSKLDQWKGQTLPFERVAWVKLTGVPLHLIDSDVLSQVGALFGKVLYAPKEFEEDQDLSVVRVGVLVSHHRKILDEVVLSWRSRSYRIGVEEELEVWIPDCLKRIAKSEGAGNPSEDFSPVFDEHFSDVGGSQTSGGNGVVEEIPTGGVSNSQGNGSKVHGEVGICMGKGVPNST